MPKSLPDPTAQLLQQALDLSQCIDLEAKAKAKAAREQYETKWDLNGRGFFNSFGWSSTRDLTLYVSLAQYLAIAPDKTPMPWRVLDDTRTPPVSKIRMDYPLHKIGCTANGWSVWITAGTPLVPDDPYQPTTPKPHEAQTLSTAV